MLFAIDGYSSKREGFAGHSSVYKFISSRRKPTGNIHNLGGGYIFLGIADGNGSPAPRFETDDDRTYFVSYFPVHPLAVSKETAQVGTKSGPSHRTSLELLPGAAQVLRNYGIDWS